MQYGDLLQTIAEVAVAFVGFAGLASIFGRRFSRDEPAVQEERLRGMIHTGLTAVAFAFIPFVVAAAGADGDGIWQISSGLLALTYVTITMAMLVRSHRAGLGLGPHPVLAGLVSTLAVVLITSQALNALGRLGAHAADVYLVGVLLVLANTAMFFTRLLSSLSLSELD